MTPYFVYNFESAGHRVSLLSIDLFESFSLHQASYTKRECRKERFDDQNNKQRLMWTSATFKQRNKTVEKKERNKETKETKRDKRNKRDKETKKQRSKETEKQRSTETKNH